MLVGSPRMTTGSDTMSDDGLHVKRWINEDELPENYPYDEMFARSRIVDGVRMFPPFEYFEWKDEDETGKI